MTKAELTEILERHQKWLDGEEGGERANLFNANLFNANLPNADLSHADLSGANLFNADLSGAYLSNAVLYHAVLYHADLSNADLSGANLSNADLYRANLLNADLSGADLSGADLSGADLYRANLLNADLSGADLSGADLSHANLSGADLSGADLSHANLSNVRTSEDTIGFYLQCPEEGSFIAYKKARLEKIVVLKIPEDAKRSSATSFKCRCDKAEVLRIENLDGSISDLKSINSLNDENFYYRVGETVFADSFDENRWNECSNGIHFFISRELARIYDG